MSDSPQPLEVEGSVAAQAPPLGQEKSHRPTILSFVKDLPNIITLLGLCCGVLGIYFAVLENFPAAMIAMLWAILFDWHDGPVARRISGRSDELKSFGGKLDSLVDIVSLGICPAIILLSYGEFGAWFFPGALVIIMAGAVRLAYFDMFGVDEDGTIAGLSLDITALLVALAFLLETFVSHDVFAVILYAMIVVLAFLHVAPFRMPKMAGRWYHVITAYVLVLTAVYGWQLWTV